jgi:hypothetical protein
MDDPAITGIADGLAATEIMLEPGDIAQIRALDRGMRLVNGPCWPAWNEG